MAGEDGPWTKPSSAPPRDPDAPAPEVTYERRGWIQIEDGVGVTAWSDDVPAEDLEEAKRLYGDGTGKGGGVRILVDDDGENG